MIVPLRSFARHEHGQAVVEFAFSVVALLIIVLGIFDVGRAVWYSDTLAFATREGARFAIVNGALANPVATPQDVLDRVQRNAIGVQGAFEIKCPAAEVDYGVCVTWKNNEGDPDKAVGSTVTVSASSKFTPFASSFFLGGALRIKLSGSTTMIIHQ